MGGEVTLQFGCKTPNSQYVVSMPADEEWADAAMLAEEILGKPEPCSPEQGIRNIERRNRRLRARRDVVLKLPDTLTHPSLLAELVWPGGLAAVYSSRPRFR